MYQIITIFLLSFLFVPVYSFADNTINVTTNHLTKLTFMFQSTNPVKTVPIFITPPEANILNYYVTAEEKSVFDNTLQVFCVFEKEGNFNLGPFIFQDTIGQSISVPSVNIKVSNEEIITFSESKKKNTSNTSPRFYTLVPNNDLYPLTPVYLILELPQNITETTVIWQGWDEVFVERGEVFEKKDGLKEVIYTAFFTKPGSYNLAPIKFRFKSIDKNLLFSTSSLQFSVKDYPEKFDKSLYVGNYNAKLNLYSGTERNYVTVDVILVGNGYQDILSPPIIEVEPKIDVYLSNASTEYTSKFPQYAGMTKYTYFFKPHADGIYHIKMSQIKSFDPVNSTFKSISSITKSIKVQLPSGLKGEKGIVDIEKELNIKIKPDYDFYLAVGTVLFITFTVLSLYIKSKLTLKRKQVKIDKGVEEPLVLVQRSLLKILENLHNEPMLTLSPMGVKEILINYKKLPIELIEEIYKWLEQVYKALYLGRGEKGSLVEKGVELVRSISKINEETKQ